jgi:PTH1 family peptidyl-tRNA hydrolase
MNLMIQLVAFLGNPGHEYEYNRHNAAWMLANVLPFNSALDWRKKYKGLYACMENIRLPASDETAASLPAKLHFIKPQTFMNRSGESVLAAASFYKIKLDEIIIVHDEIELPFGTLSLKFSGGLGGHNGLRSMKASFGSADFWRLRIGIGRPDGRTPGKGGNPENNREAGIADWVLSDFTSTETEALAPVLATGAELLTRILATGPAHSLPEWAKKQVSISTTPPF